MMNNHSGHIRLFLAVLTAIIGILPLTAATSTDSVSVYFRVGQSKYDPAFDNNGVSMDSFIERLRISSGSVDSVVVRGYVSPEGHTINMETPEIPGNLGSPVISETPQIAGKHNPRAYYMALKSNMLYDAALVPNIAAEFYLGKNLSVTGEWMYAWWDSYNRHRYWRIYGGDLGLRWWFGSKAHGKPLTGHHLGIMAGALTFDFELGDYGYMGGKPGGTLWDRCLFNSGIEYGYSLPVGSRLNIDFSISLGFLGGNYIKYFPFDNEYFKQKEYKMRFVGPTKAEVSLVWLIGRGNVNKKGGAG